MKYYSGQWYIELFDFSHKQMEYYINNIQRLMSGPHYKIYTILANAENVNTSRITDLTDFSPPGSSFFCPGSSFHQTIQHTLRLCSQTVITTVLEIWVVTEILLNKCYCRPKQTWQTQLECQCLSMQYIKIKFSHRQMVYPQTTQGWIIKILNRFNVRILNWGSDNRTVRG